MFGSWRRQERIRLRMPVTVTLGDKSFSLLTEDVSAAGVFVRTDMPAEPLQLVQVDMDLPLSIGSISVPGVVVWAFRPTEAEERAPGMGIRFYPMEDGEADAWRRFLKVVERRAEEVTDRPVYALRPGELPLEPIRRRYRRVSALLRVCVWKGERRTITFTRDISDGGMFLTTDYPFDIGEPVELEVYHPEREDTVYKMSAVVRRRVDGSHLNGIGVEFTG